MGEKIIRGYNKKNIAIRLEEQVSKAYGKEQFTILFMKKSQNEAQGFSSCCHLSVCGK